MWVQRKHYEELFQIAVEHGNAALAHASVDRELRARIAATDVTCDWLRIRCTQLEKERAQLILQYTGVRIETPNLVPAPKEPTISEVLNEMTLFEGVDDDTAKKLGISHNPDGTLSYSHKA